MLGRVDESATVILRDHWVPHQAVSTSLDESRAIGAIFPAMTPQQFEKALAQLGMTQSGASRFLDIAPQTVRRYIAGTLAIPTMLTLLLTAMTARRIKPNSCASWPASSPSTTSIGQAARP
jgi:hypothetical protein